MICKKSSSKLFYWGLYITPRTKNSSAGHLWLKSAIVATGRLRLGRSWFKVSPGQKKHSWDTSQWRKAEHGGTHLSSQLWWEALNIRIKVQDGLCQKQDLNLQNNQREQRLEEWLKSYNACLPREKPWVQTLVLKKKNSITCDLSLMKTSVFTEITKY
jgi:hypothetical protein